MNPVAAVGSLIAVVIVLIAAVGLLRMPTPYARLHAAGKASPVAFFVAALAASTEVGWAGAGLLLVASSALVLTLPVAVHLLFRAVHVAAPEHDPVVDEMSRSASPRPTSADR